MHPGGSPAFPPDRIAERLAIPVLPLGVIL